ncbi:unnamed protein product [Ceratitis capitata]|uniref:(Mediterranean fruit fly) hypothetical protein n=1 Tax=Ceratitis capitata TaxID=7213 RepID=A0A811UK52_CERCA|nr:unnamed protein product [Ceratitis capitata]
MLFEYCCCLCIYKTTVKAKHGDALKSQTLMPPLNTQLVREEEEEESQYGTSTIRQTGGCNMPHLRKLAVGYESELSADKREMSLKRSLPSQSASSAPLQSF